jgi:2-phosphoglycolate phosphatase
MKTNFYAAVLFDLDGTLLDSARDLHACLNRLLTDHNKPLVNLIEVQKILNHGASAFIKLGFGDVLSLAEQEQLQDQLLNYYQELMDEQQAHFFSGTLGLLHKLTEHNICWGIVTNKYERFTKPILKNLGLLEKASVVICGDQVRQSKPSAEPLLIACKQIQTDPKLCCYVGDTLPDMLAAKAAQMPGLLACWGYWPRLHYTIESWPYTEVFYQPDNLFNSLKLTDRSLASKNSSEGTIG